MLRVWLPQHHLIRFHLHSRNKGSFLWAQRASSFIHHLHTSILCLDSRRSELPAARSTSGESISTLQRKSKGQKKREAARSVDWATEFASFSDSQLRRAIRWGKLENGVYEAVRVAKKIGRYGKHAWRRQLKLIGAMLRTADPELMESIIKAIKDGDVEGLFDKTGKSQDVHEEDNNHEEEDDDDDSEDYEEGGVDDQEESFSSEEDFDDNGHDGEAIVERWFQGLLSGDSDVIAEVYSIRSAYFNRQELRRLVRDASKSPSSSSDEDMEGSSETGPTSSRGNADPRAKLREYLFELFANLDQNSDDD